MQDRWVSYIYRYKDEKRCENAGYIKVIRTSRGNSDEARVQIGLKLYKPVLSRCRMYLIHDTRNLGLLEELLIKPEEKDVINVTKTLLWKDCLGDNSRRISLKDCHGMLFVVDDGDTLMSIWDDRDIAIGQLSFREEKTSEAVEIVQTASESEMALEDEEITTAPEWSGNYGEPISEPIAVGYQPPYPVDRETEHIGLIPVPEYLQQVENSSVASQDNSTDNPSINPIENIFNTHIKLPQFIDSPFAECVKLVPQDIGKLPIGNWKLGQNSFLTHAYYKYKYIMLGKLQFDNQVKCIIGVPGVYTNKERYMANMFGFTTFITVKRADIKTGNFGYWVWEILRE